jgi:hypothetical protein
MTTESAGLNPALQVLHLTIHNLRRFACFSIALMLAAVCCAPALLSADPSSSVASLAGYGLIPTTQFLYSAQRKESGYTIVVDQSGVTELDPEGKIVANQQLQNISRTGRY